MPESAYADPHWVDKDPPEAMPATPPTQDELPSDDGVPMETQRHKWQMDLLIEAMDRWLLERGEGYVNGNMFVYFSLEQTRGRYFRGPDCFVLLGVPRGERKSWVIWEQGKGPDVVIELLSISTATVDKGEKMAVYRDQMRVPEYYWFDPFHPDDRAGFVLRDGRYQRIEPDADGSLASPVLGLSLRLWSGVFRGIEGTWLRWADADGEVLPTDAEAALVLAERQRDRADAEQVRADAEQARAETEHARAEAERARAERAEQELARLRASLKGKG
jgi:Uma2 family endonuclease